MWWQIYDQWGNRLEGGLPQFQQEIAGDHQPIVKVEMLNTDLIPVGESLYSDPRGQVQNIVSDGNVDVDIERGTRRTAELTFLNPSGEWSPSTEGMDPDGWYTGLIYINRAVRIWRGVKVGALEMYVPVGTFLIDQSEVIVEQNMSMVNLTMSDFWKKLHKSKWTWNGHYDKGTFYYDIVRDILDKAGVPLEGPMGANLDWLHDRDIEDKRIQRKMNFSVGESRGERLLKMGEKWDLNFYFDPLGIFHSEDRTKDRYKQERWHFASSPTWGGSTGGLISVTRTFNDDNLYNHVVVIGTGNEKEVVRASRQDDAWWSKTGIPRIGQRTLVIETDHISKQWQANRALNRAWDKRFRIAETITAEVVCNPLLEADDVVRITEREYAKVDGRYRLRRFNVPLITSRQTIEASNILRETDF